MGPCSELDGRSPAPRTSTAHAATTGAHRRRGQAGLPGLRGRRRLAPDRPRSAPASALPGGTCSAADARRCSRSATRPGGETAGTAARPTDGPRPIQAATGEPTEGPAEPRRGADAGSTAPGLGSCRHRVDVTRGASRASAARRPSSRPLGVGDAARPCRRRPASLRASAEASSGRHCRRGLPADGAASRINARRTRASSAGCRASAGSSRVPGR